MPQYDRDVGKKMRFRGLNPDKTPMDASWADTVKLYVRGWANNPKTLTAYDAASGQFDYTRAQINGQPDFSASTYEFMLEAAKNDGSRVEYSEVGRFTILAAFS